MKSLHSEAPQTDLAVCLDDLLTRLDRHASFVQEDYGKDEADLARLALREFARRGIDAYRLGARVWFVARDPGVLDRLLSRPAVPSDDLWSSSEESLDPHFDSSSLIVASFLALMILGLFALGAFLARVMIFMDLY